MSKLQKQNERQLIDIINNRSNENKCGECGSMHPTWASWNLGIFLCGRCASVHRRVLPSNVSKVKSLTLDTWTSEQIDRLRRIGNKRAKKQWNSKREPFPFDDDDTSEIEQYIRSKYIDGRFRDEPIDKSEYEDKYSRYSDEDDYSSKTRRSRSNSLRSRSRSNSVRQQVPKLTHRKLTSFESTQFKSQVNKILSFGYKNPESIQEALILSNGDIDFALDILEEDAKSNPSQEEVAPSLPSRPRPSISQSDSFSANNPLASMATNQTQNSNNWWSGSNVSSNATGFNQQLQQPQIYQYTDPVTGRVSYIDSNGQEYLDPSNPQHQQLLYQQQNPQLVAQQTNKQQILSLYNQPDNFSSNVAVPVDQLNQSQQSQQPQQPQPQPQQFQQFQQFQQSQQQFQQPTQQQFQQPTQQSFGQQPQYQQQQFMQQPTGMGFQQTYNGQYQQFQQ